MGIAFGPTGDLFAASFNNGAVYRIDGTTGQLKAKISGTEVSRPVGLTVGPDGDVYVTDNALNRVVRYDGRSGVYKGVFASGGAWSVRGISFSVPMVTFMWPAQPMATSCATTE